MRGWADFARAPKGVQAFLLPLLLIAPAPAFPENELATLANGKVQPSLINPTCFADRCSLQTKACAENGDCVKGLACAAKCMGDTECTVSCFARFGNQVLDDTLSCTIEDQACLKIAVVPPGNDAPQAAPKPPKPLIASSPQSMQGKWYKVMGFNNKYDCFECQQNSFSKPTADVVATNFRPYDQALDIEVEYSMPRQRAGQADQTFRSVLHEKLVFDTDKDSQRTAHTEGKMFGLTFWENWYVIGQNDRSEPPFRFVYYTGKTLQNTYEGAFVYAREPDLPQASLPHIYRLAREAGLEPTNFCAIDNRCFTKPLPSSSSQAPLFTSVAEAAEALTGEALPTPPPPSGMRKVLIDIGEIVEDPRPAAHSIFSRQKLMKEVREYDFDGKRLPSQEFQNAALNR